MNKAIVGAFVIAAAIAAYLLWSLSGDSAESSSSGDLAREGGAGESGTNKASAAAEEYREALPRPLRMTGEPSDSDPSGEVPQYIREDGTVVRDHRSNPAAENHERRVTLPKSLSPVQPETLAAVRSALRPAMNKCIDTHAANAPEGSSAQAVLTVSIQDEALKVDTLKLSTEGLAQDEELKDCIREAILGHEQQVAGAKDVAAHTMTFPYNL